jgi:hypothetical protein
MVAREFFSGRSRVRVPLGHNCRQPPGPLSRPPEISCSFRVMASGGTFPTEHFAPLVQSSSFHRAVCPQRPPPPRNPPVVATARCPPAPTLPRHHSHPPLCLWPRRAHPNPALCPISPRLLRLWRSSRHHHSSATRRRSPPVRLRLGVR